MACIGRLLVELLSSTRSDVRPFERSVGWLGWRPLSMSDQYFAEYLGSCFPFSSSACGIPLKLLAVTRALG